ncbi:MAG: hypothetical protein HUN04_17495 [Desulfobacter sp.]|nr:MAG: hypothetical protein HUN04_17495 [Desulfobacter sp.]
MRPYHIIILIFSICIFTCQSLGAATLAGKAPYIPEALAPWKDWVLHGKEKELSCIPSYNNGEELQCAWPTALDLRLDNRGGTFTQSWQVFTDTWVLLPGNTRRWPADVKVDGRPGIVLEKKSRPGLVLAPGSHTLTGTFTWSRLPEHLTIPAASGLISLQINNEVIPFPDLDGQGRLWLKRTRPAEKIENRLNLESFRLIDDDIPARIEVRLSLDVAGSARQLTLGPVYSPEILTPLSLKSPLPARLEQDGRLKVQVRPGRYELRLLLRHSGTMAALAFTRPNDRHWPKREIWSFKARPDLRLAEISGVPPVDPLQTSMPGEWHTYPAYMMMPRATMAFKEIKRGDPRPAPDQLDLDRDIWLRFDGSGYTIRDRIQGKKNTNWRLEMDPAISLGSAVVDGREQLITRRKGSDKSGLELRNGRVDFTADSTYDGPISRLPATGWDHDFQQVKVRLHLPPGWKLINASGMDNISRTWIKKWTLLDFFVVLIFTIALAKLYSKKLAGIAFVTLVLTFHEPNAPRYIWPLLLTGFALLKYLPRGKMKNGVKLVQGLAVLAFILMVIPYSIQALRVGIYPQLESPWTSMNNISFMGHKGRAPGERDGMRAMDVVQEAAPAPQKVMKKTIQPRLKGEKLLMSTAASYGGKADKQVMQYDPKALTQTGPGLPAWRPFETVRFSWSGPVTKNQAVGFTLVGPRVNLALAFARVSCIILLALGMFGIRYRSGSGIGFQGIKGVAAAMALVFVLLPSPRAMAADIPSPEMLKELERRLLEKDQCFPACADIPQMRLDLTRDVLSVTARVDARIDTALPLPGNAGHWLPARAVVDKGQARGLFRKQDKMWILVPKGQHTIKLDGPVQNRNSFQLPFNLKPRHLDVNAEGWSVDGVHPDGSFDPRLQFKRLIAKDETRKKILETGTLPAFARVERTLLLGLVWKVRTRVQRISPSGSGMVMDLPLLDGESVTTEGIRVEEKAGQQVAKLNFRADQRALVWDSFLDQTARIQLKHSETTQWTEIWKVDVSPIFHLEYEGIPVILHKTGNRWYPTWHPWPGEGLALTVTRPAGVGGPTLTIEKSLMTLWPGRHNTKARMDISLKSSQGGQHTITLPDKALLQEVRINDRVQPIRQNGNRVALPISPGSQEIRLDWMDAAGITARYQSPAVDLGAPSVNAGVDLHLPRNRWPLFIGGDQLVGPAVLFWSVIIIIFIIALGLSRTGWTPLNFLHWFLLCLGMSMSHPGAGLIVAAWLIALHFRKKAHTLEGGNFNMVQVGILVLSLAAGAALVFAISNGLLGHPDMNIRGNGSSSSLLRWYHDISGPALPRAWVVSIPMLAYRIAMLAWALWVSFWLVGILKWGWQQFTAPVIWQKVTFKRKQRPSRRPRPASKGAPSRQQAPEDRDGNQA